MTVTLLALVALLAFANGANDNCKGVATLVGHGATTPWRAMLFATITTLLGAMVSFWFSSGLIKSFSTGLFVNGAALNASFFVAVLIGAIAWVFLATFTGMPVSTTHAITGALVGAGLVAFGRTQLRWNLLGTSFGVPLALSPLLSTALVYAVAWPVAIALRAAAGRCVCVFAGEPTIVATTASGPAVAMRTTGPKLVIDEQSNCADAPAAVTTSAAANTLHWFSGGFVGFARGWNDAPKIAALGLIAMAGSRYGAAMSFAVVALAMAAGGLVAGMRVLETLAKKVTPLPLAQSVTASLTTATLVGLASWSGLPVSTTHVATGAIIGAGLQNDPKSVHWGKVGEIVLSWLITLPVAALVAAGAAMVLRRI